ncbi:MAG: WS/DGAT/MGAT family O-acyltransferase [Ilumatobacteraceae bacterium]
MKQLTGLDGSFLYMETATSFGHVNGLGIYSRPSPDFDPYEAVYDRYASFVGRLEPMRRRVVEVPLALDHPYWVDDAAFDLDFHVRHLSIAPPGRVDQLGEQISRIVGRPMDRTRPLWEVYVIEGLESGRWALLTKYHHATIDGASGVMMMMLMHDLAADAPPLPESPPWTPDVVPTDLELLRRSLGNLTRNPVKLVRTSVRIVRDAAEGAGITSVGAIARQAGVTMRRFVAPGDRPRVALPITAAPPTPWNRSITAHRRFAMRSASLSNLKRLKDATGGTLNDVVMAISAGALREYLLRHDALPDKPLRAMVPVSIRTGDEEDTWTNRVSGIIADLPTDCADPIERVVRCREAMNEAKRQFELVPAQSLVDITQYASPVVATSAIRLASQLRLANRMTMPINVIISNVPGPRQPLYFSGSQLEQYIPVSTIAEGMGLNITVHSYLDEMTWGLIACRELVPDLWDMVDLHIDEIDRLFEATGAEWAEPKKPAPPRRGPARRASSRMATAEAATTGATERSTAMRSVTKQRAARKTAAKKTAAKKAAAKRTAATRTGAARTAATKTAAKRTAAKRTEGRKGAAKRTAPAGRRSAAG